MKTNLLLIKIFLFNFLVGYSQIPEMEWNRTFGGSNAAGQGDNFLKVIPVSGGGFVAVGFTDSNDGDVTGYHGGMSDGWVVKINETGEIEWRKALGGSMDDILHDIVENPEGTFTLAGHTNSSDGDISQNNGSNDAWLIKLNAEGEIIWSKTHGADTPDYFYSIILVGDGYIAAGQQIASGWTVKFNFDGEVIWENIHPGNPGGLNAIQGMCNTNDGGFVAVGRYNNTVGDAWMIKFENEGNVEWERNFGGSQFEFFDEVFQSSSGDIIASGQTMSNDGDVSGNHGGPSDGWIVRVNMEGEIVWQRPVGGSGFDPINGITEYHQGGIIAVGNTTSMDGDVTNNHGFDGWVIILNESGEFLWDKNFGGTSMDGLTDINRTNDNGYIISGATMSSDGDITTGNQGGMDAWLIKLEGEEILCADPSDIVISNITTTTADVSWTENGSANEWEIEYGLNGFLQGEGTIIIDNDGVLGETISDLTPDTLYDVYVRSICSENESEWVGHLTFITEEELSISENGVDELVLYPNPTTGIINLQTKEKINSVSVYNLAGQKASFNSLNKENTSINISNLPNGIYFVEVTLNNNKTVKRYKVIKK